MSRITNAFKRVFRGFDTTLIFPPKEETGNRNFKGQVIKKRSLSSGGPMPNVEEIYSRQRLT